VAKQQKYLKTRLRGWLAAQKPASCFNKNEKCYIQAFVFNQKLFLLLCFLMSAFSD